MCGKLICLIGASVDHHYSFKNTCSYLSSIKVSDSFQELIIYSHRCSLIINATLVLDRMYSQTINNDLEYVLVMYMCVRFNTFTNTYRVPFKIYISYVYEKEIYNIKKHYIFN